MRLSLLRPLKYKSQKKRKSFHDQRKAAEKSLQAKKFALSLIQDQERRRTGKARFGGFLLIATGCRIAKMQDFPVADMIPAMVLVMPLSALWTNYIAPLL